jgi:hypothetical protein
MANRDEVSSPERDGSVLRGALERLGTIPRKLHGGLGYHRGPRWVNRLGYQVFRAAYKNVDWWLRRSDAASDVRAYVDALDRDGCVAIPDFLEPQAFDRVRAEYDDSRRSIPYKVWVVEDNGVVEEQLDLNLHREAFAATYAELVGSARMQSIIGSALRRPLVAPRVSARIWFRPSNPPEARGFGHVVGANYGHADMHFPTFKAWLYLNDIDETNGAFRFALGSHKMTLQRLAYEYDASIRVAANRHEGDRPGDPYALVRAPTPAQAAAMGLAEYTSMCGARNTLVIANTQGFHQQGLFQPDVVREAIHVCYRMSEPA